MAPSPHLPESGSASLLSQLAQARAEVSRLQTQLDELRERDPLTGLPTRLRLLDRTGQAILLAQRQGAMVAVVFVELDRFKAVNQTLNWQEGDALVLQITARLQARLSPVETLARVGTDQFVVLMPEVRDPGEPLKAAQGFLETLARPYQLGQREVRLTASIGISVAPQDGDRAEALHKEAENTTGRAKAAGGNSIQCTTLTLSEASFERQLLESYLGEAIRKQDMQLFYQPQVTMAGVMVGVEALLRWTHPLLGPVPPSKFIPLAEENQLIHTLGEWTLASACRQAALWQRQSPRPIKVAVNVSPLQLAHPHWLAFVTRTLEATGLAPSCLELEITESILLKNARPSQTPLHDLKALGVGIGIDDFGTGYSSLSYLQRFPIDTLKIDQTFVSSLFPGHPEAISSKPIVQTIVDLGNNLGMTVLAEGVETPAQRTELHAMGCQLFQGYLTGRPMAAEQVTGLLGPP